MKDKKVELLERLIKENKISLREAIILLEEEEKVVPLIPYTPPSWTSDPFTVTCKSNLNDKPTETII